MEELKVAMEAAPNRRSYIRLCAMRALLLGQSRAAVCELFNRTDRMTNVTAYWEIVGIKGKHKVRDLWLHADMGSFRDAYSAEVPAHGVTLLRVAR